MPTVGPIFLTGGFLRDIPACCSVVANTNTPVKSLHARVAPPYYRIRTEYDIPGGHGAVTPGRTTLRSYCTCPRGLHLASHAVGLKLNVRPIGTFVGYLEYSRELHTSGLPCVDLMT